MADNASPQTPGRRLFKPAKATPPVRKQRSVVTTPHQTTSASTEATPKSAGSSPVLFERPPGSTPRFVRKASIRSQGAAAGGSSPTPKPAAEDIAGSTRLAPLTSKLDALNYTTAPSNSSAGGGSPIGLIDNEMLTPTDVEPANRSWDGVRDAFEETMTGAGVADARAGQSDSTSLTGPSPSRKLETFDDPFCSPAARAQTHQEEDDATSKPSAVDSHLFAQSPTTSPANASSPDPQADFARYFTEQGNPELGEFVKALTAPPQHHPATATTIARAIGGAHNSGRLVGAPGSTSAPTGAPSATSNPLDERATQEISTSHRHNNHNHNNNDYTSSYPEGVVPQSQELGEDNAADAISTTEAAALASQHVAGDRPADPARGRDITGHRTVIQEQQSTTCDAAADTPVGHLGSQPPDRADVNTKPPSLEEAPRSIPSPPTTADMSEHTEDPTNGSTSPAAGDATGDATGATGHQRTDADGTTHSEVNNMGKPARINRQLEIPIHIPDRRRQSPPKTDTPGVDGLPSTDNLPSTDGLEDPPEEFLDPSVHLPPSPAAVISPVPDLRKVTPIASEPPPDLPSLAHGLGGHPIDDVGNIVDESGTVLGHATGDLPAMIGRTVAENGEIYGDNGELIGFVIENFTNPPPPPPSEHTPLPGGLSVDTEGNILDRAGNIVGKMNTKPGSNTAMTPYLGNTKEAPPKSKGAQSGSEKPEGVKDKDKAKEKKDGIPADIFLDVKSTADGIQLTIRIPTVFKQETRETTAESELPS